MIDDRRPPMKLLTARRVALGGAGAALAGSLWWRKHPSACPYGQRFWVELPHPLITRSRLCDALALTPGERVLEIGPGTGYYTLELADRLGPDGTLEIFDVQRQMLDHTIARARERGLGNVTATCGDAQRLPHPQETFDAACMVAVLGEIPDQGAALGELARVLRPGGRLVVGELFGDPHWVSPRRLKARAEAAGLHYVRRNGSPLGYFAVLERPAHPSSQAA